MKNYGYIHVQSDDNRSIMLIFTPDYQALNLYNPPLEDGKILETGRYVIETQEDFNKLWDFLSSEQLREAI